VNKRIAKGAVFNDTIIEFDDVQALLEQVPS